MKRILAVTLACVSMCSHPTLAREFDAETGLIHMRARDYDPETGRFLQEDPLSEVQQYADRVGKVMEAKHGTTNAYYYAFNSPVRYVDPLGLYSEDPWAFFYDMDNFSAGTANFSAGLGDALLLGTGGSLRGFAGIGGISRCSTAYKAGGWASFAAGSGRIAYAGLAKGGAMFASSGKAASLFRFQLRNVFRLGMAQPWREPNLAKYATDDALRAAAGRTNLPLNLYGLGVAGAGAAGGSGCGCP